MHSTQLCVASLLCYSLTPTQRVGKRKRSKSLTLQVGLSLENLYSDVLRRRENNDAKSQLHMAASNPEISHLTLTVQSPHNSCFLCLLRDCAPCSLSSLLSTSSLLLAHTFPLCSFRPFFSPQLVRNPTLCLGAQLPPLH